MKYIEYPAFMSPQECQAVIDYCKDRMQPGASPDPANNMAPSKTLKTCNNNITFIRPGDHQVVEAITQRMEFLTGRPRLYYEPIQVLRYDPGQYYSLHVDNTYPQDPNPRKATFQIYMSNVEEGGETRFSKLGLTFKPIMGKAVYWYNFGTERDNEPFPSAELNTEHEGAKVIRGTKWTLTAWIKLWPIGTRYEPKAPQMQTA